MDEGLGLMITAPYNKDDIDPVTVNLIKKIRETIGNKDDDFLLPIVGTTGTGKSRLSLHLYELFDEDCSVDFIGLDQKDFATALNNAKNKDHPRFCCYDEANINRQQHMTSWNKDLEDLYMAIRGLQIFHVWNNPTAQKFPRTFIEERIKGLIYVFTKDKDKPRLFYYFNKAGMLKMYDACKGELSHRNMKKHAKKHAMYRGWFRDYKGKLMTDYNNKKLSRMDIKVESFFEKYADQDLMTQAQVAKALGVTDRTISIWHDKLGGMLVPEEDYTLTGAGHKRYTRNGLAKIKEYGETKDTSLKNSSKRPLYIDAREGGGDDVNNVDVRSTT